MKKKLAPKPERYANYHDYEDACEARGVKPIPYTSVCAGVLGTRVKVLIGSAN